ncbi:MAG: DUF5655 domain-containing protein [Enterocloster bolteae]
MDSTVLLFFEKMPQALPIYEAFTKRLLKELGPVQVKVQKSQIAFSNRYQFAFIWHPSRRFRGRKGVYMVVKYSLQGTTQGNGLTGGVLPVRFSM